MEIESELWTLKLLLGVTLTLTSLLVILSVVILLKLQLKRTSKLKKKQMELPAVIYRNNQVNFILTMYFYTLYSNANRDNDIMRFTVERLADLDEFSRIYEFFALRRHTYNFQILDNVNEQV